MRILRYIASPWTTLSLCLAMAAVYIAMSFGGAPYSPFLEFLFRPGAGLLLYAGLIANLSAWSIFAVICRVYREALTPEGVMQMDGAVHLPASSSIRTLHDAREWFVLRGFSPRLQGEGMGARKGSMGILPGIVLRTGISLMMLSALVSHHVRETDEALLAHDGKSGVSVSAELFGRQVIPVGMDVGLPEEFLDLGKASFAVDDINALMRVGESEFAVSSGYPTKAAGIYWRVRHLGYFQQVQYGGETVSMFLDVFPPGNASAHSLSPSGGQIYEFRLAPEKSIKKGLITGDVFDLGTPKYELSPRGIKGRKVMARTGQRVLIDGREAFFGLPGYYVRLQAVRDPALPFMIIAFYITSLGALLMIVRFFWYERRMAAVMHEGRVLIGYSEEFYRKWGIYKLRKWTEPLL